MVASAIFFGATVLAIWIGLETPGRVPTIILSDGGHAASQPTAEALPTLESFAPAWNLDLRRPLYDPPPTTPIATVPLALRLTATIIEPGQSMAVLLKPDGSSDLKTVGQSCNGAELMAVDNESVTVKYQDKVYVLKLEKIDASLRDIRVANP